MVHIDIQVVIDTLQINQINSDENGDNEYLVKLANKSMIIFMVNHAETGFYRPILSPYIDSKITPVT